jgi:DNA-binding SARP family transcriptional activator/Tfp pilus assembly protein PilF
MGERVEFRLLGPVEAWCADRRVELGQPRQRCVAAVLLTEANRVVPAGTLVERVWGEQPPASARSAVYSYLTRIKAILRQLDSGGGQVWLTRASGGYLLEVDSDAVDLHRFDQLVDQARTTDDLDQAAAMWASALELWRGDPYQELTSDWLDRMRDTLLRRWLAAVLERNDVELARGRHAELLAELTDLCDQQPFDERLAAQLMLAEYRNGRQAEALDHFQKVRHRLAEELGVDPGADLSTLYEQILHNEPSLVTSPTLARTALGSGEKRRAAPVPAQLPTDVRGFTSRVDELAQLDTIVAPATRQPTSVVISAVSGTAGVGKTALAVHWAHRITDRFPDGQLYVNLRGFDPGGHVLAPADAVRGFLETLGIPPERIPSTLDAKVGLYRSLLAGKRMLVVLDNARDAEQVRPLLPGTPTALTVVTSRNQLTSLVAVEGAHPLTLDLLSTTDARELLTWRLGPDRVTAEPDAVDQIITACARLPLALAIAAARAQLTGFPLATLATELDKSSRRLDVLDAGDAASQVRAVFSWSYTTLTLPAARLFRLLGLHPGPDISIPATTSLAGHSQRKTHRLLTELVHANLLVEHIPGRYTLHDLLRAYAINLATDLGHTPGPQHHAAVTRMLDHYLHSACAADRLLYPHRDPIRLPLTLPAPGTHPEEPADNQQATTWLATEHHVLLAAIRHAAHARLDSHTWQLAWALSGFLYMRGPWHDQVAIWEAALHAADRLGHLAAQADAHRLLGYFLTRLGHHADAHVHLEQALDRYVRAGDPAGPGHTHHILAFLEERLGHLSQALDHAQQALTLFQAADHLQGQADALNGVGWYHSLLGDHTQALTYCEQALGLHQQLGDRDGEAVTWDSIGHAHHHLGHHALAVNCYQRALILHRSLGDRHHQATTLTHLGDTHHAAGNPDAARTAWQQALTIFTDLDHPDADDLHAKLHNLNPHPTIGTNPNSH